MALKLAGFLDPDGQCKPFLADGGGYCRVEGAGLVVLKCLSDAIRDGDRIHGVIRGMGTGNMSSPRSIIRPDGPLQGHSLARAVASSGLNPSDVSFVEAHGLGTQQGDPAE
jgi:acyl transferase domain-containing protein